MEAGGGCECVFVCKMITMYKIYKTLPCGHAASSVIFSISHIRQLQLLSSISALGRISRRQ